jgi:hypothetical protein
VVNLDDGVVQNEIGVPGRTRWTVYDPDARILREYCGSGSDRCRRRGAPRWHCTHISVPAVGPHGLELDLATHRLFCACDEGTLVTLDAQAGRIVSDKKLSGTPDVIFYNHQREHLYVAVGDPGVIDVFDTSTMRKIGSVVTEKGAHTLALAPGGDQTPALCAGSATNGSISAAKSQ